MNIGQFDSVYRLILVASERCARIIAGEPLRTQSHHIKPTYVALDEVLQEEVAVRFKTIAGEDICVGSFPCEPSSE